MQEQNVYYFILAWLFKKIYPSHNKKAVINLLEGSLFIKPSKRKNYAIMLEFFHDNSNRIDPSYYLSPQFDSFSREILPHYWDKYKEISSNMSQLIPVGQRQNKTKGGNSSLLCSDICEFDGHENGFYLAGIFCHLGDVQCQDDLEILNLVAQFLDLYKTENQPVLHDNLNDLLTLLKIPKWIGVMNRQDRKLKFVYPSSINKNILINFFDHIDPRHSFYLSKQQIMSLDPSLYRLCLDYNFNDYSVDERICLEFSPKNPAKECRNWELLDTLQKLFSLNINHINDVKKTHLMLPYGIESNSLYPLKELHPVEAQQICAFLSHYKISFYLNKSCDIKSYMQVFMKTFD